jgi:Serine carboxypeptidase S28
MKRQLRQYGAILPSTKNSDDEDGDDRLSREDNALDRRAAPSIGAVLVFAAAAIVGALLVNYTSGENGSAGLSSQSELPLLSSKLRSSEKTAEHRNRPRFFDRQLVDHFSDQNQEPRYWSNRYYQSTKYFAGGGHPIFLIVGGEGALDPDTGMLYPFVTDRLAQLFGAAVLEVEHRFYGPYVPVENATAPRELLQLLTPHQAMSDMVRLVRHVRDTDLAGCSPHRASEHYCPVIAVGGSYPGFLSAMLRVLYPDVVDISYAASAPLLMYAQAVNHDVYYDIVTTAAERSSPGCAQAVRTTLVDVIDTIKAAPSLLNAASLMSVCLETLPAYLKDQDMFQEALVQITSFKFADENMENYPPSPATGLYKVCQTFQQQDASLEKMKNFLMSLDESAPKDSTCFDMTSQLPKGAGATLEDTDGDYRDGEMWDFQTCTNLIFLLDLSETSMFPTSTATFEHLTERCRQRFGVTPRPWELVDFWGFDDLSNASNILFTNGLQDMWSGGSYLQNVSDTVIAINFENGAHHSDLLYRGPTDSDTDDVREGFVQIEETLALWLRELKQKHKALI